MSFKLYEYWVGVFFAEFEMDRRSWLWRRKSLEKSPGETESSGSISSHSERFSDDQAYSNHNTRSPEVTSKATASNEELNDSIKTLTEKLEAAHLNISAKEDLVKQHAKVAEEAVSGWEKAENEVFALKQQLEAVTQKWSSVEDRVIHLDGALKECLRQLRQEREEQEHKIHEAIAMQTLEWESTKSELENRLIELQSQLQPAKDKALSSFDIDLRAKLEAAEKENSYLKLELFSSAEELELRTIERDLSTQAAETASKQHLDSVKKVAKLENECRWLKVMARKEVENNTWRMSELESNEGEPNQYESSGFALTSEQANFKNVKARGTNLMAPLLDMSLMDDFLEMERLAALPETGGENIAISDQSNGGNIALRAELEIMSNRISELEEKLVKVEAEKNELEMALTEHKDQLSTLRNCLVMENEARGAAEVELEATNLKKEVVESRLEVVDSELKTMLMRICGLEEEIQKERAFSGETMSNCRKLEEEICRLQHETDLRKAAHSCRELKEKQDKELAVAASKFAECQKTIASLGQQLKSLASLEDFLIESEKPWKISKEEPH